MQFWVVAWLLPLFPHLPRLPLVLCVLGEHREAGSDLGHLLATVDVVEVPLLIGGEVGRLSAVAADDGVLLPG